MTMSRSFFRLIIFRTSHEDRVFHFHKRIIQKFSQTFLKSGQTLQKLGSFAIKQRDTLFLLEPDQPYNLFWDFLKTILYFWLLGIDVTREGKMRFYCISSNIKISLRVYQFHGGDTGYFPWTFFICNVHERCPFLCKRHNVFIYFRPSNGTWKCNNN